ncbi:carbohydrate ABC transporter membrane protein 1 (CUT1 family) [Georgenia soli]|uniref:Carbohydrate ABC transporter membrane protein 1 (CUT1 family) n=1 Tax=Georgenia soli TaxID=638953 RepID=A0A2A9F1D0_9MICO|nr:sugar ABC transporter permease [Georgenia soli]PFG44968.1 carbohydrate ABC transporter membrane protein 1 (CUT1 family) [Georgenia soli]
MTATTTLRNTPVLTRASDWANKHRKWVLAAPAIIFVLALMVLPLAYTMVLSFTDAQGSIQRAFDFVWLDNYVSILTDTTRFWPAVWRTLIFTVVAVSLEMTLGMAVALLMRKPFMGRRAVRVAMLLPLVATPVAVAMMWLLIFEPTIGFANQVLGWFGIAPQGWISDPATALPTLMLVDVWQWTPMVILILLAGLVGLPEEQQEAARIDGASNWQRFWHVTLPMLKSTIIAALLLRSIDAMKTFDLLYVTKGTGGGSSHEVETLNIYAYALSFDYNEYGMASALVLIYFLLIVAVLVVLTMRRKGAQR